MLTPARAAAALILHLGLVLWLSWPLARHLATHLPDTWIGCRFDGLLMAWVLAYESHRLATEPSAIADANIYHPTSDALFTGEAGFGALPWFLPTFLASGNPTLAFNVMFILSVVLTAWALHVVVCRWTGSHVAGALAGWTFLMTRWVLWTWVPSTPSYGVLVYSPFIMFLAAKPALRLRELGLLCALLVLQGLASVYVAVSVFAPLGIVGLGRLLRSATRRSGLGLLATLATAGLVLLVPYAGYLRVQAANPTLASQTIWLVESARRIELPWDILARGAPTAVPLAGLVVIVAGGLTRAVGRTPPTSAGRGWWMAGVWAVVGLLISLGPARLPDGTALPTPHGLVAEWLPLASLLRKVDRFGVAALLGVSVLVGLAFTECVRRLSSLPRALAGIALAAAMYGEYDRGFGLPSRIHGGPLPRAYPLAQAIAPPSPVIDALREPGGPLLELPIPSLPTSPYVPLESPEPHARAMYRSIFHWRPLLNGYRSFWPAGFDERMALAARLPDPAALAALRSKTGLAVILVHTEELTGRERVAWLGAHQDLRLVTRDGPDMLFEVRPP